jgi:hypothetical protein
MSLPNNEGGDVKIIESKTICYLSNFDLNVNEWFNEYENIEIFKLNMKKNLGMYLLVVNIFIGSMWLKYFNEAVSYKGPKSLKEDHLFSVIFNFYLMNYYSPASSSSFKL